VDRKIHRLRRFWGIRGFLLLAGAITALFLNNQTFGQERRFGRGGFQMPTPEESFSRFDSNGDGRLDPDEISSSRFLPRMLGDADLSRGLSRDEFIEAMQRARQNFERNGFGGRGGSRGPGGRDGTDSDRRGDRDGRDSDGRSRSNGDDANRDGASGDSSNGGSGGSTSSGSTANGKKSRPRVTVDLQSEFLPGDTDRDGQLGLYEWRRFAGRTLSEFRQLDRNQDGFVTPAEVAIARPDLNPTPPPATDATPATPQTASSPQPAATPAADSASGDQSESQPQPGDEQAAQDAERFFRLLDTDRDGQIAPEDWEGSSRIRSMFTDAGVDLSEPIDAAEFDRLYVRLSTQPD
jgi:Ca2+-binding EF-hand superfamily protein